MSQITIPEASYRTVLDALVDAISDCEVDNAYRAATTLQEAKQVLECFNDREKTSFY